MKLPTETILPPPALGPGDRVAVVAPAGACRREDLEPGLALLRELGLVPVLGEAVFERERFLAGSDSRRAAALMQAFADASVAGIICARGGYGSMRLLPLLDFEAIAGHPKPMVGFSDLSALLWAINARTGMICFHGPTVLSLADADAATRESLRAVLFDPLQLSLRLDAGRVLVSGKAQGRLCGGNLTTLTHLVGTAFRPSFEDGVVVLEDRAEAPYRIDRMLTQLRLAGVFDGTRAVVLGDFSDCGKQPDLDAVFRDRLADMGIPVTGGLAIGHGRRNLTLPMGLRVRLDTDIGSLEAAGV